MSLICLNGPFKGLHGPFKILIGNLGVFVGKPACKGYSGDPAGHHCNSIVCQKENSLKKTCFESLKSLILTTFGGYKSKVVKVVNFNDYAFSGI